MTLSHEITQLEEAGEHTEANRILTEAAGRGDVDAMTELGKRLLIGNRLRPNPQQALSHLSQAATSGGAEAMYRLAVPFALGAHVPQNWTRALSCMSIASERGYEPAREQLRLLSAAPATINSDWQRLADSIDINDWLHPPRFETLNDNPVVRRLHGFVSDAVCDWLIGRSRGRLSRALVYDAVEGREIASEMRTNTAAMFNLVESDFVTVLLQYRMAASLGLSIRQMEAATVLHYDVGEEIAAHFDFVDPLVPNYDEEIRRMGQRIVTFLVYLNEDYSGGETEFIEAGIHHRGSRGEGLYFINALEDGSSDTRTAHASAPITAGEKWIVAQFVRNRPQF